MGLVEVVVMATESFEKTFVVRTDKAAKVLLSGPASVRGIIPKGKASEDIERSKTVLSQYYRRSK